MVALLSSPTYGRFQFSITHILHFGTHSDITYDQNAWTFGILSISFNNSFANSIRVFPLGSAISCMIHPIFLKTSAQTTTSLILMFTCFYQAIFTCQKHKNIFVFGHTFLQAKKTLETWYNKFWKLDNCLKKIVFSLQRSLCAHHLKYTHILAWNVSK